MTDQTPDLTDRDKLRQLLASINDCDPELAIHAIASLSHIARCYGLLDSEQFLQDIQMPELRTMLGLVIDGTDPEIVRQIGDNLTSVALERRRNLLRIISQGVLLLQSGCNPRHVYETLHSIIGTQPPAWVRTSESPEQSPGGGMLQQEEIDALLTAIHLPDADLTRLNDEFEEVMMKVSDRDLQLIIREIDSLQLALALRAASRPAIDKVISNLSIRASHALREDIICMGKVRREDAINGQAIILEIFKRLITSGDIAIS